jgi:hypothetical protein
MARTMIDNNNNNNNTLKTSNKKSYNKYDKNKNNNGHKYNTTKKINRILTYNIKIGENNFCLSSDSLNSDAPNFFTAAFFGYFSEAETTSIFIERDPIYFSMIVRYLRGYEVDWPINEKTSMINLLADVKYYGFEKLQYLLEELYEENFPEKVLPWKIVSYAFENDPVVAVNIKDVEFERWDSHSMIYDVNPILKTKKPSVNDDGASDNATLTENHADENNDDVTNNNVTDNTDNTDNAAADATNNEQDNADKVIEPNSEKGLYRLEVHGRNALATVTSNWNNGIKFEKFALKNPVEEETFSTLTKSFRTPEGSFNLSPSLKLPFLKDACVEIDGSKYYTYNELSTYFGTTSRSRPLYFEEFVVRIDDDGAFLIKARACTISSYYASQPFVHSVRSR